MIIVSYPGFGGPARRAHTPQSCFRSEADSDAKLFSCSPRSTLFRSPPPFATPVGDRAMNCILHATKVSG